MCFGVTHSYTRELFITQHGTITTTTLIGDQDGMYLFLSETGGTVGILIDTVLITMDTTTAIGTPLLTIVIEIQLLITITTKQQNSEEFPEEGDRLEMHLSTIGLANLGELEE